jgi:hypothetical protein
MLVCGLFRTTDFGEDRHGIIQSQWTGRLGLASGRRRRWWLGARKVSMAGREAVNTRSLLIRFQLLTLGRVRAGVLMLTEKEFGRATIKARGVKVERRSGRHPGRWDKGIGSKYLGKHAR